MIDHIMEIFLTADTIEHMGNWYPRVLAVMSCVIPTIFILGAFAFMGLIVHDAFKALR